MSLQQFVELALLVSGLYVAVGLIAALWLAFAGLGRIDPVAREGTLGYKILIIPGLCVFWPLFVFRVLKQAGMPEERNAHRARSLK